MGMNALEVRRRVMLAQPHEAVASGAVASFRTDVVSALPMEFDLNPIQDLHGQANPYPPGGGKNKARTSLAEIKELHQYGTWNGNKYTFRGIEWTVDTDSAGNVTCITANGTASQETSLRTGDFASFNGSYILNGCPSGGNGSSTFNVRAIAQGGSVISSDYGSSKEFTVSEDTNITARITIYGGYVANNLKFYPMIRLSSVSDATFAPYSNICPITGHDGFTRYRTGKNLFDKDDVTTGYYYDASGVRKSIANGSTSGYISVKAGQTYSINKYFTSNVDRYAKCYDINKNAIGVTFKPTYTGGTFTIPDGCAFIRISTHTELNSSIMITVGSGQQGDYAHYTGVSKSTTFPTPPGTVYGGHVVDNGDGTYDLTVTMAGKWLSTLTWANNASYANVFNGSGFTNRKIQIDGTDGVALCDTYKFYTSYDVMDYDYGIALANTATGASRFNIYVKNKDCANKDEFVALLQEHDVFVVCPLQTPVQYTGLTLTALQSLIGQNHIWVDNADSVSVEYWGH